MAKAPGRTAVRPYENALMADMNLILQFRDTVSARECSLLLEPSDAGQTLGALLERYLRNAPIDRLLEEIAYHPFLRRCSFRHARPGVRQ